MAIGYSTLRLEDPARRRPVLVDLWYPAASDAEEAERVAVPVQVVGAVQNDFLPFEAHAARYAQPIPGASLARLENGEGHFVFLDVCSWDREVNGVPPCRDRAGVDRARVHEGLKQLIAAFFANHLLR